MHDDTTRVSLEEDMLVTKADQARENVTQHQQLVMTEGEIEGNKLPSQAKLHRVQNDGTRAKASVSSKSKSFKLGVKHSYFSLLDKDLVHAFIICPQLHLALY